uniref:Cap-specific mRNA (nucleoside-2'-O-)-methyltransferase 1 n=1 Tax=Globodera pallida TaxID=36090 RepID=A0A183CEV8_GLOPA
MERKELDAARSRANPYETVKAGFFQNRAAMKTANLDKIFEWRLSWEFDEERRLAKNPINDKDRCNVDRFSPPFYFADVCAGPGGFSEYMLWRKAYYNAKGFGFTLAGKDDFKLDRFKAASSDYFETFYGVNGDGDVTNPDNLESLEKFVDDRIHTGVHLVMCDGGFSVEGQENLQEVLSKRIYLCQFIVGLSLCRTETRPVKAENGEKNAIVAEKGGNFLCKLFDVFTPFSMGLIYLMYLSFERISLHKPITSRPANSERYIFCESLNSFGSSKVKKYLVEVNNRMESMERKKEDVMELVPDELIRGDDDFMEYIRTSIEEIARRQVFYLKKYRHFASNPGTFDQDQAKLREDALKYWDLPDFERPKDTPRFNRNRTSGHMEEERQMSQNQRPETVGDLFRRYSGDRVHFPIKRQIARFTEDVLQRCSDAAEMRALLMPERDPDSQVLLVSTAGHKTLLMMHRRNGSYFEAFQSINVTLPKSTILLVQCTTLYEDTGKSMHPLGKCLWVLDAAVLNEDDVSEMDLKARNAAVRKFAAVVNRLQTRRGIFEKNPNKGRGGRGGMEFSRYTYDTFAELIVAEPMRMKALTEQKFIVRQHKGSRVAFFPVWARNDRREPQNPPKKYLSFERISLHKPITSRPANSESKVKKYLVEVNNRMESMERKKEDVMELVPDKLIRGDDDFMEYIRTSIEEIARRQVFYLKKYRHFASNPGTFDQDQAKLREDALKYWDLPDFERPKDTPRFNRNRTSGHMEEERQMSQNQRPETVGDLFRRYSGDRVHFPIKRQIARFTEDVLQRCSDAAEMRALLMPERDPDSQVLLVSTAGHKTLLMMHRRNGSYFEAFQSINVTLPKSTILLVQCTTLYEDTGKSMHPLGKCLWVLDAAVLNEDDVSEMDLKARNAAVRKFAAVVNRLQTRRGIFEKNPNKGRGGRGGMEFSRYTYDTFAELIVAEPMRMKALTEQKFIVRQHKGSRVAFFPVWARNDRREPQNPPKKYFLECHGVRIQNVLNPNFMLARNECNREEVKPRPGVSTEQSQCTNFYDSLVGWAPDYTANFTIEHILNPELEQHPSGLTMSGVRRLIGVPQTAAKSEEKTATIKREREETNDMADFGVVQPLTKKPRKSETGPSGKDETED